jgi:sugar lactone lactonase YvrE
MSTYPIRHHVVDCIVDCRSKLGEGAFWCPQERAVYWLDVPLPSLLHRYVPRTGRHDSWPMPEMISAMAKRADGSLLVASQRGINTFHHRTGELRPSYARKATSRATAPTTARRTRADASGSAPCRTASPPTAPTCP